MPVSARSNRALSGFWCGILGLTTVGVLVLSALGSPPRAARGVADARAPVAASAARPIAAASAALPLPVAVPESQPLVRGFTTTASAAELPAAPAAIPAPAPAPAPIAAELAVLPALREPAAPLAHRRLAFGPRRPFEGRGRYAARPTPGSWHVAPTVASDNLWLQTVTGSHG